MTEDDITEPSFKLLMIDNTYKFNNEALALMSQHDASPINFPRSYC